MNKGKIIVSIGDLKVISHCYVATVRIGIFVSDGTVMQCLALSPHSKNTLGLNPGKDISLWSLYVLPVSLSVLSGYSSCLPQPQNIQNWRSG